MTRTEHSRTGRIVGAAVILLAVMASACNELPAEPIEVDNTSDQRIGLWGISAAGSADAPFGAIAAGTTQMIEEGCVEKDLEARLDDGTVVAERPAPFCEGDPVWIITQAQVDAATSG